ncbi:MAG TPA: glutamate-5-semialdehyde dehydrogenase [Aggregatilineales bacterium]|nr:glutamate-5-semialdehyde dehydrogenase [Anaerolineales bacterium]HRE49367.1 glutamate-5-semialdehyde dehydrogenase [Aggregatilineales bacterium]
MTLQTDTRLDLAQIGQAAREAGRILAKTPTAAKNAALYAIAEALIAREGEILAANDQDMAAGQVAGMTAALLDRLSLAGGRLAAIAADVRRVAELDDPVGEVIEAQTLPNGLAIERRRTPLGVVGVIYEARPNVTVDVAALTLKTSNAAILRGGKETIHSNAILVRVIREAIQGAGLPADAIQAINDPDRRYVGDLLRLDRYVDMIIPRGGAGLHQFCRENSTIPVITGGIGICHLFVDESAKQAESLPVIFNAKTQRPSVCNALDTLLVHERVAASFIPRVVEQLGAAGVTFHLDPHALPYAGGAECCQAAGDHSWDTEWLSLVLGIKVVTDLDEAIQHIQAHSTFHSDGILTEDAENAARFLEEVDSAAVYVNASTRFTDGSQLGLGAEIAISTQKLHARGPLGLRELTSYKWVVRGAYHVRT